MRESCWAHSFSEKRKKEIKRDAVASLGFHGVMLVLCLFRKICTVQTCVSNS